jgi:type III restriction enzyme
MKKIDKLIINSPHEEPKQYREYLEAKTISDSTAVGSFVKNDHLGFAVLYNYQGVVRRYFPDFIIKLNNGDHLVLETKGQDTDQDKTKRVFLDEWCRGVTQHGGFGKWTWAVSFDPNDLETILQRTL